MILALLLAQASVVDAERALAADSQKLGQWTAFRNWVDEDAIMFDPQPVAAQIWLKDRKDPPRSLRWWPTASYVSCDGVMAANTGGWQRADGSVGYFTTVWFRGAGDRWRWQLTHGDVLNKSRAVLRAPTVRRARCSRPTIPEAPVDNSAGRRMGWGSGPDDTLRVFWSVGRNGERSIVVRLWNGRDFDTVINDRVLAPKP